MLPVIQVFEYPWHQAAESSGAGTDRGGDGKKRGAASQMAVQPPIEEETPVVKLTEEEIIQNTR